MKKFSFLFYAVLSISTFAYSQSKNTYPVFILDDTFSHAQPKDSKIVPQNYQLSSLPGFKLDCSKYDFNLVRSMNAGKNPDALFIVSRSGNYVVELNITGGTVVDSSTMYSLDNPKKEFKGFEKGDTPILGIGTLKIEDGKASMVTYWISMIDVK